MTKWVCFDQAGAEAVRSAGAEAALRSGDTLIAALHGPRGSVVILPGSHAQELALVSIVKRELPIQAVAPVIEFVKPVSRVAQASGFLGLSDEPEFADEAEKKTWWKRWTR